MKFIFEVKKNEEYGMLGLQLKDSKFAEPLVEMTAVHDIMEHFQHDDGGEAGELMALGASIYTRGSAYFNMKGSFKTEPYEHLSGEFRNILDYFSRTGDSVSYTFKTKKLAKVKRLEDTEAEYQCEEAAKLMVKEDNIEGYEDSFSRFEIETIRHNIGNYLRIGYRKAKKRYKGIDTYTLAYVFNQMEEQLAKEMKFA